MRRAGEKIYVGLLVEIEESIGLRKFQSRG